jgi:hypothetical protein
MIACFKQCSKPQVLSLSSIVMQLQRACTFLIIARVPQSTSSFIFTSPTPFLTSYHRYHCNSIIRIVYSNKVGCSMNRRLCLDHCYSKPTDEIEADAVQRENDTNQLIETQKKLAIELWEQSFQLGNFDETVYTQVLEQLKNGFVPPYFHTLCRKPKERLFFPRTKFDREEEDSGDALTKIELVTGTNPIYIELSTKPVQVGEATLKGEENRGRIPLNEEDDSYLSGFFCSKTENARDEVLDEAMPMTWTFNKQYTKIVTDLINTPSTMVGHNIEVTHLESPFYLDGDSGNNLISRSMSRGIVADCFSRSKKSSNHAIVGNPGIGKSWTHIYIATSAFI